jgi:hypothetical protein
MALGPVLRERQTAYQRKDLGTEPVNTYRDKLSCITYVIKGDL